MTERTGRDDSQRRGRQSVGLSRTRVRLQIEPLEERAMMAAALAAIPNITSPAKLGSQVILNGSASNATSQTYTVTSSNPVVKATIAQGQFVTFNVTHTSSGANDASFSGSMTFQLFDDLTPVSASRIEQLVSSGFYNGKNFHRISAGFPDSTGYIAQGGSVTGTGLDSPPATGAPGGLPPTGYPFDDEYNLQLVYDGFGQLALANAGNDTNTSQFYVTTSTPRFLDFNKAIFGQIVSGQDILTDLTKVATGGADGTTPISPVIITSATLSTVNPNGVVHVDTTGAAQGATSTVTVTATDPTTSTSTSQSFQVNVGATNATPPSDPYSNERAFLGPVPASISVGSGQKAIFKLNGINVETTDTLTYSVTGGVATGGASFLPVANATATVDANGIVTVTPTAGFTGTINLLLGVRDQVDRSGTGVNTPSNYDSQNISVVVNSSTTPIGLAPITTPVTASATANIPTTVQLAGQSANPGTAQGLNYAIVTQPAHGTITGLNAATGTLIYTANPNFIGTDTFTYNTTSTGSPTPNFVSNTSTVTLNVSLGMTNAVRLIGRVLVITPPARFDGGKNTIGVTQANGVIQTTVNGVVDANQPAATALDQIIVYGTKLSDSVVIDPTVPLPTTIDGGHGGVNFLTAGAAASRIHGWFGKNLIQGGVDANAIVGRLGHVKVLKSAGTDKVFLSPINPAKHPHYGRPSHGNKQVPAGSFYKFVGNKLVKTNRNSTSRLVQAPEV